MEKLVMYRKSLDEIDEKIIELYEKRMNIVKLISRYKEEHNFPTHDQNRENSMLEKNLNKIKNEEYKKYYKSVLNGFLEASKAMQDDIKNGK